MFSRLPGYSCDSVTIYLDGAPVTAAAGEYVAAVLARVPPHIARRTALSASPRAPYCMMGTCTDCAATVDGVTSVLTCQTVVAQGMRVERQAGPPELGSCAKKEDHDAL